MGRVEILGVDINGGRIERLRVNLVGLPPRTIERDTAISWLRDGHTLVPVSGGRDHVSLTLVEIPGDEPQHFVRDDFANEASDRIEGLPGAGS